MQPPPAMWSQAAMPCPATGHFPLYNSQDRGVVAKMFPNLYSIQSPSPSQADLSQMSQGSSRGSTKGGRGSLQSMVKSAVNFQGFDASPSVLTGLVDNDFKDSPQGNLATPPTKQVYDMDKGEIVSMDKGDIVQIYQLRQETVTTSGNTSAITTTTSTTSTITSITSSTSAATMSTESVMSDEAKGEPTNDKE